MATRHDLYLCEINGGNLRNAIPREAYAILSLIHILTRASAGNRMVAGVCAGIADYFGWDPTLLRIVYVSVSYTHLDVYKRQLHSSRFLGTTDR